MKTALVAALLLCSPLAAAAPPTGVYEAKWAVEGGQKKDFSKIFFDMLKAGQPNLAWVRMLFIFDAGRLQVRMQSLERVPDHPDHAIGCDAAVTLDVTWSGADLIVPVTARGEGKITRVHKAIKKSGNVTDTNTNSESDTCSASIQKGTMRVTPSAGGLLVTDSVRHQTIELVRAAPEPEFANRF